MITNHDPYSRATKAKAIKMAKEQHLDSEIEKATGIRKSRIHRIIQGHLTPQEQEQRLARRGIKGQTNNYTKTINGIQILTHSRCKDPELNHIKGIIVRAWPKLDQASKTKLITLVTRAIANRL